MCHKLDSINANSRSGFTNFKEMRSNITLLFILFIFLVYSCEEIEKTEEDYLPKLNFLLLSSENGENLLSAEDSPYSFDEIVFSTVPIEGTNVPSEIFPIALNEDPTYGSYISVDLFGDVLWEDYLVENGTSFSEQYLLNLSAGVVDTVRVNIRKVAPSLRMYVTFNSENAVNDTIQFDYVFMK